MDCLIRDSYRSHGKSYLSVVISKYRIAATTWIDGMTNVLQVMLLLATLIWTVVKIAQAIKDFHGD